MRARKEERNQAILEAHRSGKSQYIIAKDFGLSQGRVCKIIHNQERLNLLRSAKPRMNSVEIRKYIEKNRSDQA